MTTPQLILSIVYFVVSLALIAVRCHLRCC